MAMMPTNRLMWMVIGRRAVFCIALSVFCEGWAGVIGDYSDGSVGISAFVLGFFVPLRELRLVRDSRSSEERVV